MDISIIIKRKYIEMIPREYRDLCLNIGCGYLRFRDLCRTEIGLDIELRDVDVLGDAHRLPFRDNVFGTVIAYDIIEHSTYYGLILDEAYRVLRNNGYLVLSTIWIMGYAVHTDRQHVHCFTEELLRRALERHGFKVLRIERYSPQRDNIIVLSRKAQPLTFSYTPDQSTR